MLPTNGDLRAIWSPEKRRKTSDDDENFQVKSFVSHSNQAAVITLRAFAARRGSHEARAAPSSPGMERVRADVRVTAPVTAELVAHALREAVKFLLFVRQQIPASYDELRAALLQTVGPEAMGLPSAREATGALTSPVSSPVGAKRKRVTSVERAAVKLFREMDAALGCLTPEMLRAFEPSRVALFLGSTPARPKEMFVFSLADVNARGGYARHDREESPETTRALGNAGRRVVRECLPAVSQCAPASAVGKAFVMVRARGEAQDGSTAACPVGFLPKRDLERGGLEGKNTKVRVDLTVTPRPKGGDESGARGALEGGERDGSDGSSEIWYQCGTAVKGLKSLRGVVGV